jgi:hypothetical protein
MLVLNRMGCMSSVRTLAEKFALCIESYRVFFYHPAPYSLCNMFVIERSCMKLSQMALHTWEICFLTLAALK